MTNRAIEFLNEAHSLLHYWQNIDEARLLVRLAIKEVQELLERLALSEATNYELTRCIEARSATTPGAVLVADVQLMTPARLTTQRRAALPGNNHK